MLRAILNKICGNASEEAANPVQTTEQGHIEVEVDANNNVVVPVEEEFVEVNTGDVVNYADEATEQNHESGVVSYVIRPLLQVAKHGAKASYATALVMGYTLEGISYCMAGVSHVPYEISKLLEKHKEQNKETAGYQNTAEYKAIVCFKGALDVTSYAIYGASYVPYAAGKALLVGANAADSVKQYFTPEKIEEICDYANSFSQEKPGRLEEVRLYNAAHTAAIGA